MVGHGSLVAAPGLEFKEGKGGVEHFKMDERRFLFESRE